MGKNKKGSSGGVKGGGTAAAAAAANKNNCTCDDPYKCGCGNRPERPSRGHKWDAVTQTWAGKGHKQKGASGQTAMVDVKAQTTTVGQTALASWQRLPSQLLSEYARRQKFLKPRYKQLEPSSHKSKQSSSQSSSSSTLFKYRVILPDAKDSKKDLMFVPAVAVPNEEQAKEEASLLALLHITPKIPHERTLPEPYKTTWLNAIESSSATTTTTATSKPATKATKGGGNHKALNAAQTNPRTSKPSDDDPSDVDSKAPAAVASTHLTQGRVTSQAQKQKVRLEKQQALNRRIRRHEAIRMANRFPRVVMAAHIRKLIESLLRGDETATQLAEEDDDDMDDDNDENNKDEEEGLSAIQINVEKQLHKEAGFTKRQARWAYENTQQSSRPQTLSEDSVVYDECLQWLLLHLKEEDLPAGFDPMEGSLEVVVATNNTTTPPAVLSPEQRSFAERFGVSQEEAVLVFSPLQQEQQSKSPEQMFWELVVKSKGLESKLLLEKEYEPAKAVTDQEKEQQQQQLDEEVEALQAIFDDSCQIQRNVPSHDLCTISTQLEGSDDDDRRCPILEIVVRPGRYPSIRPERVLVYFKSTTSSNSRRSYYPGTEMHGQLADYIANTLTLDQPAIFELHGFATSLWQESTLDDFPRTSLLDTCAATSALLVKEQPQRGSTVESQELGSNPSTPHATTRNSKTAAPPARFLSQRQRRPRVKSPFWSVPPSQTTPATAFPKIPLILQKARSSLPAHQAKSNFLQCLQQSQSRGRVVLLTGETGCGKVRTRNEMSY